MKQMLSGAVLISLTNVLPVHNINFVSGNRVIVETTLMRGISVDKIATFKMISTNCAAQN